MRRGGRWAITVHRLAARVARVASKESQLSTEIISAAEYSLPMMIVDELKVTFPGPGCYVPRARYLGPSSGSSARIRWVTPLGRTGVIRDPRSGRADRSLAGPTDLHLRQPPSSRLHPPPSLISTSDYRIQEGESEDGEDKDGAIVAVSWPRSDATAGARRSARSLFPCSSDTSLSRLPRSRLSSVLQLCESSPSS